LGSFEDVVEQPGGDRFIWLAVAAKQRSHLDRMGDERRVVDLPVLTGVAGESKPERGLRDRQLGELGRRATRLQRRGDRDLVAEDALALVCDQPHELAVLGFESVLVLVCWRPRGTTVPASISWASFAFSAARPGVSTPELAASEIGSPLRSRRIHAHPTWGRTASSS
jgi:hypothetical protein